MPFSHQCPPLVRLIFRISILGSLLSSGKFTEELPPASFPGHFPVMKRQCFSFTPALLRPPYFKTDFSPQGSLFACRRFCTCLTDSIFRAIIRKPCTAKNFRCLEIPARSVPSGKTLRRMLRCCHMLPSLLRHALKVTLPINIFEVSRKRFRLSSGHNKSALSMTWKPRAFIEKALMTYVMLQPIVRDVSLHLRRLLASLNLPVVPVIFSLFE